jgi:RNA polymerase sigma factor (sigma-70 family)
MQSKSDAQLLREYAESGSESAFAELVTWHTDLVYSAALRQVSSSDLACDVAQNVFTSLARGARTLAGKLNPDASLAGWLCRCTRNLALNLRRDDFRRHSRERQAMENLHPSPETAPDWNRLRPLLDQAISGLNETDHDALVLRFFKNQDLRSVGLALGVSDDTAQKRVSRALEKLREYLAHHGITMTGAALAMVISANAVQAAPVGLAATISAAAVLAGTAVSTSTVIAATKTITMTILQKTLITATIAAAVGTGIYEAHQASTLRSQVQTLQQQQVPFAEQLTKLQTENERLSNQVVQAKDSQALSKALFNELLKLRGQVGPAQANSRELARLKSTLAEQTGKIPDYLTNAMAAGMGTAEKWKMKDAQAKLDRMKKMLNLTDDQVQAISDIMQKHIQRQTEMAMEAITGKITPEQRQAMAAEGSNQDDEIKALFTPEQLVAYPEYQQAEKTTAADKSANSDASRIADDFGLSKEQQEQIRAAFYQMNLIEPTSGLSKEAIAAAKKSGNLADAVSMSIELQKSQLEEKLKILGSVLTPEQINTYREEQMNQINMQAAAVKMLLPQKTAGTTN